MDKKTFLSQICLSEDYIKKIAFNSSKCYKRFLIPKRDGSLREILAPNKELKGIQRWILDNLFINYPVHNCAMAYVKDKSIKRNAELHINKFIITIDLKDFFPSINLARILAYFRNSLDLEVALWISSLCVYRNKMPQGAVTSPTLSNMIFYSIDEEIFQECSKHSISYTRYSDDITLSSNNYDRLMKCYINIKEIIKKNGFLLNESKTKIMSGRYQRFVTGLNICYKEDKVTIKKSLKNRIRSELYHYVKENKKENENRVLGLLCFVRSIDPHRYEYFKKYFEKLEAKNNP